MEKAMTVIFWIVGGIIAFVFLYKLLNRKDFKVIKYLKQKIGCNEAIAHRFIAFGMPELIGFKGWAKLRSEVIEDQGKLDLIILPLFVEWYLEQSPGQVNIIEESLSKAGLTFSDIERRLDMVKPMLAIYKLEG